MLRFMEIHAVLTSSTVDPDTGIEWADWDVSVTDGRQTAEGSITISAGSFPTAPMALDILADQGNAQALALLAT